MGAVCCCCWFGDDEVPQNNPSAIPKNLPGNNQNNQSYQKGVKEAPKEHIPISPVKALKKNMKLNLPYVQYIYEDEEDVCPTCLEEFNYENPKIVTKCSHEYHLSCIYEWMERSKKCPVCNRLMQFDE
ncbi:hypothetical protein Leryth_011708 [Lithospermum erythrorhizon]|nr:hypothetical protein Leryth_011708 [Lithospermum erythrorhizon]